MTHNSEKEASREVINYYLKHVRRYPLFALGIGLSIPLTVLLNSFLPILIQANVLSRLAQRDFDSHDLWGSFGPQLTLFVVVLLLGIAAWRLVDYFMWRLEKNIERDIAEEILDKLLDQTADFHANNFSGSLVSQNSKVLSSYVRMADTTIYQVYPMVVSIVYSIAIMVFKAPLFAAALTVFSLLFIAVSIMLSRSVRTASKGFSSAESEQTGKLADAITNSMAIKSFATGDYERRRYHRSTTRTARLLMVFARRQRRQLNVMGLTTRIISSSSLIIAVISVMFFRADIGVVFMILSYTSVIVENLFEFGNTSLRSYSRSLGDATDMVKIINSVPELLDPAKPEKIRINRGLVTFKDVSFTHDGSGDALFKDFSVRIQPGEKVGLVGHSGSGKTTFTRLLLRFSDIQHGQILIDGQDITAITQDNLRRNIAYVPQEPLLFHRSIKENIAYGQPEADDRAIKAVAKLAHAHEFVSMLPQGYDTLVGERGVKLSGGQRQRIAIARAMLKNAPILLLDEATSALDSESEVLIQDALWKLMEGRTAIVIAHRLSTIQHMDRIIVLDEGNIVEQGSHKELIAKEGAYAKLWEHQSGGFLDE